MFTFGLVALALTGPARAADLAAAKENYEAFCVLCHGETGKGDGPRGAAAKARDFTDCAAMSKISDDTMFNVIKNGGASVGLSKAICKRGRLRFRGQRHSRPRRLRQDIL